MQRWQIRRVVGGEGNRSCGAFGYPIRTLSAAQRIRRRFLVGPLTLCLCFSAFAELGLDWAATREYTLWSAPIRHSSVVYDNRIWILGGWNDPGFRNDVWYSTNGATWALATPSASWCRRHSHTSVVHDGRIWVIGGYCDPGENKNDVWSSPDGTSWTRVTASAPWTGRSGHSSVIHDDKMWVIGGYDAGNFRNDVWYSSNGVLWMQATASAPWSGRSDHTSLVQDGKIWVMGGYYQDGIDHYLNDVWYSSDGSSWTQATAAAPWPARYEHTCVAHEGRLWVMGGYSYSDGEYRLFNDVWCSEDGTSWTAVTPSADWAARGELTSVIYNGEIWIVGSSMLPPSDSGVWHSSDGASWTEAPGRIWSVRWSHSSVVHDGQMWVLGGDGGHGIWSSPDGWNWTEVTYCAPWEFRSDHASVVYDGKMWVLGGRTWKNCSDVWYSSNGWNWTTATAAAPWAARYGHASAVYDGKIWVLGGAYYEGASEYVLNDVWSSPDGTSWTLETASAPWPAQWGHAAVVHDGSLYLIGRHIEYLPPPMDSLYVGDVWRYDGAAWTRTTDWAPWQARTGHTVVSCDRRMWLMGGCIQVIYWPEKTNDVWSSPDGTTWTLAGLADWSVRDEHASVVFQDRIWVLGGLENGGRWTSPVPRNDIWYSARETPASHWQRYR